MKGLKPSKAIRDFKGSDYEGRVLTIKCQHMNKEKTNQYVSTSYPGTKNDWDHPLHHLSGWAGKVIGKEDSTVKRKLLKVELIEHCNGGRSDHNRYPSYKAFFNKERKEDVHRLWLADIAMRINGMVKNDCDRADIIATFKDFELDSMSFDFEAPEEWYSELYASNFDFRRGFYKDADEAIHFFQDKANDDLFGERYFPVIVFPRRKIETARDIAGWAKSCSKAIVTKKHAIFGTRCKPHEYQEIITKTYENGGQVARSMEWNW
jgi:hypothetical protein